MLVKSTTCYVSCTNCFAKSGFNLKIQSEIKGDFKINYFVIKWELIAKSMLLLWVVYMRGDVSPTVLDIKGNQRVGSS